MSASDLMRDIFGFGAKWTEGFEATLADLVKTELTPQEGTIIFKFYALEGEEKLTLSKIGKIRELFRGKTVSGERVRQIKERALNKLKHLIRSSRLRAYLPLVGGD